MFTAGVVWMWLWGAGILLYTGLLFYLATRNAAARQRQQSWNLPPVLPKITIVIAFRNEGAHILKLATQLSQLQYSGSVEVLWVNDHSEDAGPTLLTELMAKSPADFQILNLPDGLSGKKAAIAMGVAHASGEFLAFTDADCEVPSHWLSDLVAVQTNLDSEMVCGQVYIRPQSFFQHAEAVEFASLIAVAAAGIHIQRPALSNGANLLVNKKAWLEAQQERFDLNLASGDDVFLLHQFHKSGKKIGFCAAYGSGVTTLAHSSWKAFQNQRIRWAGKWKSQIPGANGGLAMLVWIFHLGYLAGFGLCISGGWYGLAAGIYVARSTAEAAFIRPFLLKRNLIHSILIGLMQIPYSIYVVYMGLCIGLAPAYVWKGRKYE